jgi:hypothetical protein
MENTARGKVYISRENNDAYFNVDDQELVCRVCYDKKHRRSRKVRKNDSIINQSLMYTFVEVQYIMNYQENGQVNCMWCDRIIRGENEDVARDY